MRFPDHMLAVDGGLLVFAHRGNRAFAPENTLVSFQQAAALGVDVLEMDIHATVDGVIVVAHDETVERMTNGTGLIKEMTLAQLKQLDAGYRFTMDGGQTFPYRGQGITIPTLAEVFTRFPEWAINIDIKQERPSIIAPFVQLIQEFDMARRLCVGSFSNRTVRQFRRACPQVKTAASLCEVRRFYILHRLGLDRFYWGRGQALQIPETEDNIRLVTKSSVAAAHRHRIAVHVWTVNETEDMERLIQMGVDGLMTDYPERLLQLLGRNPAAPGQDSA